MKGFIEVNEKTDSGGGFKRLLNVNSICLVQTMDCACKENRTSIIGKNISFQVTGTYSEVKKLIQEALK